MRSHPNRDQMLEPLLRRVLRSGSDGPATGACLDADALAAWVDGALGSREARAVEEHVSSCARCQTLVGAMARTEPPALAQVPWWRRAPAWVVPLTAGAAAVLIWMVVPAERGGVPADRTTSLVDRARARVESPAAAVPSQAPGGAGVAREGQPPRAREETAARIQDRMAAGVEEKRSDRRGAADARVAERAAAPEPAGPEPGLPPGVSPPPGAAAKAAAAVPQAQAAGRLAASDAPAIEIPSPDAAIRWRLAGGTRVERTADAGASWQAVDAGASAPLLAGSSPSPQVCWLVGRRGTVLLTADGRRWQRLPFPEGVDLVSVQASDARTATVTAADGRTFRTSDGGTTWTR